MKAEGLRQLKIVCPVKGDGMVPLPDHTHFPIML